jgi:hypothetical protein
MVEPGGADWAASGHARTPAPSPALARVRTLLGVFLNPGAAVAGALADTSPVFALAVSGSAFALFFLQTGLDEARGGLTAIPPLGLGDAAGVVALTAIGALYGTIGLALVALIAWGIVRLAGDALHLASPITPGAAVRAFALGYAPALLYCLFGLVCNVGLGWRTSIAFGVTGLLWAIGPAIATLRRMLDGRVWPSVILATLVGGAMLAGWAYLGT